MINTQTHTRPHKHTHPFVIRSVVRKNSSELLSGVKSARQSPAHRNMWFRKAKDERVGGEGSLISGRLHSYPSSYPLYDLLTGM